MNKSLLLVTGKYNYGDPARGPGYEYSNFLPALERLGWTVRVFDNLDRSRHSSFRGLNRDLLLAIADCRPAVILAVQMQYELWSETLEVARRTPSVLMNWFTDDSWRYKQFTRHVAPHYDYALTTYPDSAWKLSQDPRVRPVLTQWAADSSALAEPAPASDCQYPVTFVGSAYGGRAQAVESLQAAGVPIYAFGVGFPGGAVSQAEYRRIVRASQISLNFTSPFLDGDHVGTVHVPQVKARTFEVPGLGGFLLTQDAVGLSGCFEVGSEIATFNSMASLVDACEFFLANPEIRDEIAIRGHARVRSEHTYDRRFSDIFSIVESHGDADLSLSWSDLRRIADVGPWATSHSGNRRLEQFLIRFGAVAGMPRSARAIRRAVFDFSIRVSPAATFSARGLPGRLFYESS